MAHTPILPKHTGLWIRAYLLQEGEAPPSIMHRALKEDYREENYKPERHRKSRKLHPPTFPSFYRYLLHLLLFGLVERTGREEIRLRGIRSAEEVGPEQSGTDEMKRMSPLLRIDTMVEPPVVIPAKLIYFRLTALGRAEPPHDGFVNPRGLWYERGGKYTE